MPLFTHKTVRLAAILLAFLLSTGCAAVRYVNVQYDKTTKVSRITQLDTVQQNKVDALEKAVLSLADNIDPQEAKYVAYEGVVHSMVLANQYELVSSPLWQNVLVNYGFRENGLCWQWTRDMGKQLGKKTLKTLDFHHAVAFRGNPWKEHSTLVVTAKGEMVPDGIVLDPWRDSGVLYWNFVPKDTKYPWVLFVDVKPVEPTEPESAKP